MAEIPIITTELLAKRNAQLSLEQKLFEISPVGTLPTAVAVFALLFGSFEICAAITHYPLSEQISWSPQQGAWPAAILSLLAAVALGMQRYVELKNINDEARLAHLFRCEVEQLWSWTPAARRMLRWASLVGAILGFASSVIAVPAYVRIEHFVGFAWFACVMSLLGAMFLRGVVMTRVAAISFADRVDRYLKVDLLRIDELNIIGRASARSALIWLSVAGVVCLFFASGHTPALVIAIVLSSAGIAFWIFFRSLDHVHRKIHSAKRDELDRIRRDIAAVREEAVRDSHAAARLNGLIAYETRIVAAHEWPFDQYTLLRVGAYVLIPAAPYAGQLLLKSVMERLAQ